MTPGELLSDRLSHFSLEVERLSRELDPARAIGTPSAALLARLDPGLRPSLASVRLRVDELQGRARDPSAVKDCWVALGRLQRDHRELLAECTELTLGVSFRGAGLDDGICELGDTLVRELAARARLPWNGVVVLGPRHYYSGFAETIRLRSMAREVWEVPTIAHEFGHFLRLHLVTRDPSFAIRDRYYDELHSEAEVWRNAEPKLTWDRVEEAFADVCGVYGLGPAFARAAILAVFKPWRAADWSENHPSDQFRVAVICQALSELKDDRDRPFRGVAQQLASIWDETLSLVGTMPLATHDVAASLANNVLAKLATTVPSLAYQRSPVFDSLTHFLRSPDPALPAPAASVSEILDAGWTARLQEPRRTAAVGKRVFDLLRPK